MEDDPLLTMLLLDRAEWLDAEHGNAAVLDAALWVGRDLRKLWFESALEHADGETHDAHARLLFARAVAPFWDMRFGLRGDLEPDPERWRLSLGLLGLAPYHYELDLAVLLGGPSRVALHLEAERELPLTQRWILSPELEVEFRARADPELGARVGLAALEAGLRLRYEFRREFAPYFGLHWERDFGDEPADDTPDAGGELAFALGLRAWW